MAVPPKEKKWFTVIEDPHDIPKGWSLSHGTLPAVWRLPSRQSLLGPPHSPDAGEHIRRSPERWRWTLAPQEATQVTDG